MDRKNKHFRRNRYKRPPEPKAFHPSRRVLAGLKVFFGLVSLCAISLAFIFVYDVLTQCDYFNVREIVIQGEHRLSRDEILKQAGLVNAENTLAVNLKSTRMRLLAHAWIDDAEVGRELPGRLVLRIREQTPLALLDLGRFFLLNTRGEMFKEWEPGDPEGLIVVKGLDYADLKDADHEGAREFKAVMALLETDQRTGRKPPEFAIGEILVDREMGLTISGGERVRMVHLGYDNYEDKYRHLKQILVYIEDRSGYPGVDLIDLKRSDRIVVRPASLTSPEKTGKEVQGA